MFILKNLEVLNLNDGIRYNVTTYWGSFSLDEGSYRDYLAGKLWISWVPGKKDTSDKQIDDNMIPSNVTQRAIDLRNRASTELPVDVLESVKSLPNYAIAYVERLCDESIDEMMLTTRSRNGLLRAGIDTFDKLNHLIEQENGIQNIRCLGFKSVQEISKNFFSVCYERLSRGEKAIIWQKVLDSHSV